MIASNSAVNTGLLDASYLAGVTNLSIDFSCLFFWDSFLANLSSSEVVDPLALDNLGFEGETL